MNKEAKQILNASIGHVSAAQAGVISNLREYKQVTGIKIAYIAGKVTGLPYDDVYLKFKKRQLELEAAGYVVINPCELIERNTDWLDAMKICLFLLQFADVISLLHDWQDSKGATMEKVHACELGLEIITLP